VLIEPHPANFKKMSDRFVGNSKVHYVQEACSNIDGNLPLFLEDGRPIAEGAESNYLD